MPYRYAALSALFGAGQRQHGNGQAIPHGNETHKGTVCLCVRL